MRQTADRERRMKILYVEHDDDNLYMLKMHLERVGDFEVLAAEDSEKGCKLAAAEHPDVILMDLEMSVWLLASLRDKGTPGGTSTDQAILAT